MQHPAAYQHAIALLHKVSTPAGFMAAPAEEDNYKRVWARDATICGLAAIVAHDEKLIATFKASLQTLWAKQHDAGFLPSNVEATSGSVSYGGTVGRADTASWCIAGLCIYAKFANDLSFAQSLEAQVAKAFSVMDAWEFNGKHLIYVPQSGDWADEYLQHGYVLFDQLLRLWALELASVTFSNAAYAQKAQHIRAAIKANYFYREDEQHWYAANMIQQKQFAPRHYWWLGFNPAQIYPQFDLQANTLALLMEIGDEVQSSAVLAHAQHLYTTHQRMLPSFWPPVTDADWQMNELKNNYAFRFRNTPGQFHNGGLWPVWNGLFLAALKKYGDNSFANNIAASIEFAVAQNDFEFNECFDAATGAACGVKHCAWSAAGVLLAEGGSIFFSSPQNQPDKA